LLHRFGRTLYRQGGPGGMVDAFKQLVDFDDSARSQATALVNGSDPAGAVSGARGVPAKPALSEEVLRLLMVCNGAYLHGIVELFLYKAGLAGHLEEGVTFVQDSICARMGRGWRPPWECRHGVGHGIVQFQRHVHIDNALNDALSTASKTMVGQQGDVWNGIWMDHFASTAYAAHDADDPAMVLMVCYGNAAKHRGDGDCAMYSPTAFLLHRPRAYVPAQQWCRDGCEGVLKGVGADACEGTCVSGVGMQTLKENMENLVLLGRVCNKARTSQLASRCIFGAKGYYSFAMGHSIPDTLCAQIEIPTLQAACKR